MDFLLEGGRSWHLNSLQRTWPKRAGALTGVFFFWIFLLEGGRSWHLNSLQRTWPQWAGALKGVFFLDFFIRGWSFLAFELPSAHLVQVGRRAEGSIFLFWIFLLEGGRPLHLNSLQHTWSKCAGALKGVFFFWIFLFEGGRP